MASSTERPRSLASSTGPTRALRVPAARELSAVTLGLHCLGIETSVRVEIRGRRRARDVHPNPAVFARDRKRVQGQAARFDALARGRVELKRVRGTGQDVALE